MKKYKGLSLPLIFNIFLISFSAKAKNQYLYPIVYESNYNISFFGLEKLVHSFDGSKYGKVAQFLEKNCLVGAFYKPEKLTDNDLLKVHNKQYLKSLNNSKTIAQITEVPLSPIPNRFLQSIILNPMRSAVAGTLKALELAENMGYGINIGGGYHHAKRHKGGGFCAYADIQLATKKYLEKNSDGKVMIIDLDAHQGNGHEYDLGKEGLVKDKKVAIFDVYNNSTYPNDNQAKKYITYNHPINQKTTDVSYLSIIENDLKKALDEFQPTLILYNAGTDILNGDRVGGLSISADGICKRDKTVFKHAFDKKIPIVMVTSGGYTSKSAGIIGKSIKDILTNLVPTYNHLKKTKDKITDTRKLLYKIKPWIWSGLAAGVAEFIWNYKNNKHALKTNLLSSCASGCVASIASKSSTKYLRKNNYKLTKNENNQWIHITKKQNFFCNVITGLTVSLAMHPVKKTLIQKIQKNY